MVIRAHPLNDRIDRTLSKRPPEPTPVPDIERPAVHPVKILQRLTLAPHSLRPDDLLLLQRTIGNRAVGQLLAQLPSPIQAKLKVNAPGDEYEREADRVADEVTRKPAMQQEALDEDQQPEIMTKRAPAQTAGGAFEAGEAFEQQLRATRGQGKPLPARLRKEFETKLGADFSGVRVHTDALADQLNQSIQAKAFTTRQDVFFRRGEYNPNSSTGQQTLAHELTHVVQQAGGRPAQGQAPAVSTAADFSVQRLVSKEDFQNLAGAPSTKSKLDKKGGTYTDILNKLQEYEKAKTPAKKTETLNTLKTLCTKWITSHTRAVLGSGEREAKATKDLRKAEYIPGLLEEVKAELGEAYDRSVETPTAITQQAALALQGAAAAATKDLKEAPASRYMLALYASVENKHLLPFAQKRLELTIKNKKKIFGKPKTSKDIKKAAASFVVEEKIVKEQGQVMTDKEKNEAIDEIIDASGEVGHTWVKLRKYGKDDKLLAEHSFGFYPLKGYNRPELSVPGEVVYGDKQHDADADQSANYYDLTANQYSDALAAALGIMRTRPDYKLVDYNCTAFSKDIVKAAGQKFPEKAFMRVPGNAVSAVSGIGWGEAYNPNALYGKMNPRASVCIPSSAQQPQGLTLGAFSLGGVEEASHENPVDILGQHIKQPLTLTDAIYASPAGRYNQVVIKAGTDIKLVNVFEDYAKFDVAHAGYHETTDLAELCAALGLGS